MEKNQLYFGDNLAVLREHIQDESVDLIYLDPPFNSRQDYNVLFAERDGTRSASQIMAFEDTWEWNTDAERAYEEIVERGGRVSDAMDVWVDIDRINQTAKERLGYQTQKPETLLERIIKASSNEGDLVLDPFCGCGTAVAVAQRLNRRWIGIDITHLAIGLIKKRLDDAFGDSVRATYEVIGEPVDLSGAKELAEQDPYQFQWWALSQVGARPLEKKKGADQGIDGRLFFHDEHGGKSKQIILSVKAGHVQASHVRDLRGVIEREKAEIGALLSMEAPTKPMLKEAAAAGFYHAPGTTDKYPRLQTLSIEELLAGKKLDYPRHAVDATFKKAPKARRAAEEQIPLASVAEEEDDGPF